MRTGGPVTCVQGAWSHVQGVRSHVQGVRSHAQGAWSHVQGAWSHAQGCRLKSWPYKTRNSRDALSHVYRGLVTCTGGPVTCKKGTEMCTHTFRIHVHVHVGLALLVGWKGKL